MMWLVAPRPFLKENKIYLFGAEVVWGAD